LYLQWVRLVLVIAAWRIFGESWMRWGLLALDSDNVQSYSDRELFSIIRDGVRFTGMPGFAGTETDDQIWDVVDYLRSLR